MWIIDASYRHGLILNLGLTIGVVIAVNKADQAREAAMGRKRTDTAGRGRLILQNQYLLRVKNVFEF